MSEPTSIAKKKSQLLCSGGGSSYLVPLICFIFIFFLSCFLIISKLITYLLNLLHFLSPLLITTLFLLFIFTSYNTFIHNPEQHHQVYNIFFEEAAPQFEQEQESQQPVVDKFLISLNDNATQDPNPKKTLQDKEQKHDHQSSDILSEEKDQVKEIDTDSKIVVLRGSDVKVNDDVVSDKECVSTTFLLREDKNSTNKVVEEYEKMMSLRSVGSYGSMRVDKEWNKTLACKLFEERHSNNNGGGDDDEEGMDLLWEAYEDNNNNTSSAKGGEKNKKKKKKKLEKKRSVGAAKSSRNKDVNPVEEDDEQVMGGKLCCLQALKFSSGKVNLGMGRPNIGRISKAFRGMGWLHHVRTKKGSSTLNPKSGLW